MKHYGLEFEFFVEKEGEVIPAFTVTSNLDGNPVIGELRTKVHTSLIDAVFELKKLIHLEKIKLEKVGCVMSANNTVKVSEDFLRSVRKSDEFINRKSLDKLEEFSVYGKKVGKILPNGVYKTSLQLNMSDFSNYSYDYKDKNDKWESFKYVKAVLFNFPDLIKKLDTTFKEEIATANRVAGVYAIKDGETTNRIEYRSLPSTVELEKLLTLEND